MKKSVAEIKTQHYVEIEDFIIEGVAQEEIREWVAYAHEHKGSTIDGRHMAASILWALINEKQLITNPLLIGYAAKRVAINAHEYNWQEMLVNGMITEIQYEDPKLLGQDAQKIVSLVAHYGAIGAWPDTPQSDSSEAEILDPIYEPLSPYVFGMALTRLAGPEWAEDIATNLIESKTKYLNRFTEDSATT